MAANSALKKIQAATKKLRKENPKMDYRTAQKKASAAYNSGKLGSITTKNNKMAAQTMNRQMMVTIPADNNGIRPNGLLAGTKKKYRRMSGVKQIGGKAGNIITATLGTAAGLFIGEAVAKRGANMPLAVAGAGVALQLIGGRSKMIADAGAGMAAAGLVTMLRQRTTVLSGVNDAIDSMFNSSSDMGATGVMFDYQEPTMGEVAASSMQAAAIPMINPDNGQMDIVDQITMFGR
jgi:hypothetical protein